MKLPRCLRGVDSASFAFAASSGAPWARAPARLPESQPTPRGRACGRRCASVHIIHALPLLRAAQHARAPARAVPRGRAGGRWRRCHLPRCPATPVRPTGRAGRCEHRAVDGRARATAGAAGSGMRDVALRRHFGQGRARPKSDVGPPGPLAGARCWTRAGGRGASRSSCGCTLVARSALVHRSAFCPSCRPPVHEVRCQTRRRSPPAVDRIT